MNVNAALTTQPFSKLKLEHNEKETAGSDSATRAFGVKSPSEFPRT